MAEHDILRIHIFLLLTHIDIFGFHRTDTHHQQTKNNTYQIPYLIHFFLFCLLV